MDIKKLIGLRIKELRNNRGLTQEKLAELMGINPVYMSGIERGKENPTLNTLINLSNALDVEIGDIFASLESFDPKKARIKLEKIAQEATPEQLKLISKLLNVVIR